jgi:hypothetical protein
MYSGTTFRTKSGRVIGAHQKIDRVAYRHIIKQVPKDLIFPTVEEVIHFEGLNGPDGIKRKSPGRDEPWHFIDPSDAEDHTLIDMIHDHIYNMAAALRASNTTRVAFEAAWMAHAIVDGLTPAHHYPLEEKLEELRGEGLATRTSKKDKVLLPGKNRRIQLRNNWEFWGAKGIMTTHLAFEFGVATTIAAPRFDESGPTEQDLSRLRDEGFDALFYEILHKIAALEMYEEFSRIGWTRHLARETRDVLVPEIIKAVVLAWYQALLTVSEK